jgi:transposase
MGKSTPLFVGLDVHKDSIAVAHALGQSADPPVYLGAIGTRQADLATLVQRLQAKTPTLVFAYEAGPCGYTLHRDLTGQGFDCHVVAPHLPSAVGGAKSGPGYRAEGAHEREQTARRARQAQQAQEAAEKNCHTMAECDNELAPVTLASDAAQVTRH